MIVCKDSQKQFLARNVCLILNSQPFVFFSNCSTNRTQPVVPSGGKYWRFWQPSLTLAKQSDKCHGGDLEPELARITILKGILNVTFY